MSTLMVTARVKAEDKLIADKVLAENRQTWSQTIQALTAYMARTRTMPVALTEPDIDESAERLRKLNILKRMAGIVNSPDRITDEDDAKLIHDELMRRHG